LRGQDLAYTEQLHCLIAEKAPSAYEPQDKLPKKINRKQQLGQTGTVLA
jgi:hypothetical protein